MPQRTIASLQREIKFQRALMAAILCVASLQFFVHDPSSQLGATFHPILDGPARDRSLPPPSPITANSTRIMRAAENTSTSIPRDGTKVESLGAVNITDASPKATKDIIFCGTCSHDLRNTCNERLKYLMQRYHTPESEARESLMDKCGIDYHNEPYVLLHAGPHKTGTTLIQSFLYHSLWNNASFLEEDKFAIPTFDDLPGVFGDTGPMLNYAHCMIKDYTKDGGQMNIAFCNRLRVAFPPFLQRTYNESQHVFIIAEDLDRLTIDHARMQYYLKPYRRFRVVVSYRRLHDWLPSWYNQIMDLYLQKYIRGEARFPSFVEWISAEYDHFLQVHATSVAERYRDSGKFESVELLNMHDGTPLLEDLFCHHVPFSNATCKAILDGAGSGKPNTGAKHEYERLATKAYLRGKLKNYHRAVAKDIAAKIKKAAVDKGIFSDGDTYPTICLNQTMLGKILQTEMEMERKYFPEWYESQGGDEGLRKDFEKAQRKLCSMDDEKILDSGIFDPIFEELSNE